MSPKKVTFVVRGLSWSLRPTQLNLLACFTILILYYQELTRATIRAAGATKIYKIQPSGAGNRRRHAGWGAPTGWLEEDGLEIGGCHHEREYPRAWGAERERSASLHAMRCKNGDVGRVDTCLDDA
eukprot:2949851-Pleurochrysis_carterae.AAC.1